MPIKVEFDIPTFQRLDIDGDKVVSKAAKWAAARIRTSIRQGRDADGAKWPVERPRPRTRQLEKSVQALKVRRRTARTVIVAKGYRDDGRPNEVVLATLQKRLDTQIIGLSKAKEMQLAAVVNKEIARQLARSRHGGIITKIKKLR